MLRVTSSRRPVGLKPNDYDHEISLVDHDGTETPISSETPEPADITRTSTTARLLPTNESQEQQDGDEGPEQSRGRQQEQQQGEARTPDVSEVQHQNGTKPEHNDQSKDNQPNNSATRPPIEIQEPTPDVPTETGRQIKPKKKKPREKRETAIDILYENQRGGFLCGMALFSGQALGGLDPSPWTNSFHKCSPTDIFTAQLPDPSWEWAWPEWRINHQEGVDTDGWEYSFHFSKKFSWHGPRWWNSFVRRRAWVRKRVHMRNQEISADPHMLNTDYFTVQPAAERRSRSRESRASSCFASKTSASQNSGIGTTEELPEMEKIEDLLRALRLARIDREKLDAVENYLENAEDLERLQEEMHEIMSILVFQASRRLLLSRLMRMYDEVTEQLKRDGTTEHRERQEALREAVKHADEEVRKLAYWSDVKKMTQSGDNRDAVDSGKGWDDTWQGLDQSGGAHPRGPEPQESKQ